ncbi:MAG TPA: hypothetical protein VF997_14530 [Polyangia bacterium]
MRVSSLLLLLLVPALALADASTPRTSSAATSLAVGDRAVTVGWGDDGKIHVRVIGGGELVLEPAGRAYVAEDALRFAAELAPDVAPVPLVKVSSRPEACSDYFDIYVSVVDGVPRQALALFGAADPPAMQSSTVRFTRDGGAVVTTRTSEDDKLVRTRRTRYRFDGRVYVDVSKRAGTRSK